MTTSHPVIGILGVWVCCRAQRRVGLFHSFDSVYTACETSDDSVLACHVFVRVIDRVHSPRKVLLSYSSTWFCSCRTAHKETRLVLVLLHCLSYYSLTAAFSPHLSSSLAFLKSSLRSPPISFTVCPLSYGLVVSSHLYS